MMELEKLKSLVNTTVERIFIIAFPPFGEESISQIDMRLGIALKGKSEYLFVFSTNLDDIWSPVLSIEPVPSVFFNHINFNDRMRHWMNQELDDDIKLEYYEFTESDYFVNIVGNDIESIKFLTIEGNPEPFGLKISFKNDFIISFPNSDGNTIETFSFNKNESLDVFNHLGNVIQVEI